MGSDPAGSDPKRLLRLTIAYEGTGFAGWQRQKNARTVQAVLEQAFRQILQEKTGIVGAGRTDAGVHAQGQVAHAAIRSRMPLSKLHRALNAVLPEDVLVRSLRPAPQGFHARYRAKSKWYRYTIWNDPIRPLIERRRALHVPARLDLGAMRRGARRLLGRRDFRAFHSSGRSVASTVRTLKRLSVWKEGKFLFIDAEADGFLYHMVRRIAGLLLEAGKGKPPPPIPPSAPARGLCLMQVHY